MPRTLVLIGGGHAHIEFIRRWGEAPVPDVELIVFDGNPRPVYSGMVPGVIAGQYAEAEAEIDLAGLCAQAGAAFVNEAVIRVDAEARLLESASNATQSFDLASFDIGSTVAGKDAPGVREHALASRPIGRLVREIGGWFNRLEERDAATHVVGGGAAGIELAFCLDARLRARQQASGAPRPGVEVVTADARVLGEGHPRTQRRVERALAIRGIGVRTATRVEAVTEDTVVFDAGEERPSQGALWVTGPAAHPLAQASRLPCDSGGFLRIASNFQLEGHPDLFAVGDCASMPGLPKAGVYAVRAAPVLDFNLRARLQQRALRDYIPQRDFLSLLNLGDGTAIGSKWGFVYQGRAALWLKDRIDRAFMTRYQTDRNQRERIR